MAWVVRPIVWFSAASILTTILHELAHVCTAYILGVHSTLYNYYGNLDLTPAQAATNLPAIIRVAGPGFCLLFGLLCCIGLRPARGSAAELPLLYLSVFGIATFFGNLMSTPFVGDFSSVAVALDLPMPVRYMTAVVGVLGVAAVHFWAGRQLVRWTPVHAGRVSAMLGIIVLPVALGMAGVILVNSPMPAASVAARLGEASFWIFSAVGALATDRNSLPHRESHGLRWADGALLLFAVLMVRLMIRGIPFVP